MTTVPDHTRCSLAAIASLLLSAFPALAADAPVTSLTTASVTAPVLAGDYRIGPDDTLDINVFQVADLTRTVQVDSSGMILLPLVGQIRAAGNTSNELSQDIAEELGKRYLKNPQVTVTVKDSTSQKVTIDGAVIEPGIYPLTGPTTLLQAVSLAKGPDPKLANTHKVSVYRIVGSSRVGSTYSLDAIRSGKTPDPPVYGRDIVVVAGSGGKSFLQTMEGVLPMLALFRPF